MATRYLTGLVAGFILGSAFGVAFGTLASLFEGGPTVARGIAESWWWFAGGGALTGASVVRADHFDRHTGRTAP